MNAATSDGHRRTGGWRWLPACLALLVTDASQALYRDGNLWPKGTDGVTRIKICFVKSGELTDEEDTRQRGLIQEVLNATWARWMKIEFSGFGTCGTTFSNYTLAVTLDGDAGTGGAGDIPWQTKHTDGHRGYHGSPTYGVIWLFGVGDLRTRNVITHEIGHGLGFEHEQSRLDAAGLCADGDEWLDGVEITADYDDTGTMNYCSTIGYLSRLDIQGGQSLYGKSASGQWLEALPAISRLSLL